MLAINLLKDRNPGAFIVRDSNSFPGAFGLALKVAIPPPYAANKNPSDPASELVRHYLIEPTAKGVRIKGCNNEPVFGSLSALIYQHSVTGSALECSLNCCFCLIMNCSVCFIQHWLFPSSWSCLKWICWAIRSILWIRWRNCWRRERLATFSTCSPWIQSRWRVRKLCKER